MHIHNIRGHDKILDNLRKLKPSFLKKKLKKIRIKVYETGSVGVKGTNIKFTAAAESMGLSNI